MTFRFKLMVLFLVLAQFSFLQAQKADPESLSGKEMQISHLIGLAESFKRQVQYDSAIATYMEALPLAREMDDCVTEASLETKLAQCFRRKGDYASMRQRLEAAASVFAGHFYKNNSAYAELLNSFGNYHYFVKNPDSALLYYEKGLELRYTLLPLDHTEIGKNLNNIGSVQLNYFGEYSLSLEYFRKTIRVWQQCSPPPYRYLAGVYRNCVRAHTRLNQMDSVKIKLAEALKNYELFYGDEFHPDLAKIYNQLGNASIAVANYSDAFTYLEKADLIAQKAPEASFRDLVKTYNYFGDLYTRLNDFDRAIDSYVQARSHHQSSGIQDVAYNGHFYQRIGNVYSAQEELDSAKQNFLLAIDFFREKKGNQPYNQAAMYLNLAKIFLNLDQLQNSELYLDSLKWILHNKLAEDEDITSKMWLIDGLIHAKRKNYVAAKNLLKRLLVYYRKIYGKSHPRTAIVLYELSKIEFEQQDFLSAVSYVDLAIEAFVGENSSKGIADQAIILSYYELIGALGFKGEILHALYDKEKDIKWLNDALSEYQRLDSVADKLRFSFDTEGSGFLLSRQLFDTYELGIRTATLLAEETGSSEYIEEAFFFSEKSKAFMLLKHLNDIRAKKFTGIPNSVLARENKLKSDIAYHKQLLYHTDKSQPGNPDSLRAILANLNLKYHDFVEQLEQEYPKYYQLKYSLSIAKVPDIQKKLRKEEVLVEYFYGDSTLFVIGITRDSIQLHQVKIDDVLKSRMTSVQELVSQRIDFVPESYQKLCESSYGLYQELLMPLENLIAGKELIIVPDGPLSRIAYEILLSRMPEGKPGFRNLPYLIKTHPIGYDYSATLWYYHENTENKAPQKCLAFAPDFGAWPEFPSLHYNKEEIKGIKALVGARCFFDQEATERNFVQNAPDYSILHLSTHGYVDDQDPMYSKLVFSHGNDSASDGLLHTYELYNMKLNAQLAVLSACETGTGRMERGEGIISLARGFAYAGCPAIVMSLWKVSDRASADLMQLFYKGIKAGQSKSVALQNAKLQFLEEQNAEATSPYYWAGLISAGNQEAVRVKKKAGVLSYVLFSCLALGIVGIARMFLKKTIRKN